MSQHTTKQGDYHRRLLLTLSDLPLTGASAVTFRMRPRDGGALVVNRAGALDIPNNQVSLTFQSPELDTPGMYDLEATVTFADGQETAPTDGYVQVLVENRLS